MNLVYKFNLEFTRRSFESVYFEVKKNVAIFLYIENDVHSTYESLTR